MDDVLPGTVLAAADATHRRGIGAWAAVFADGRTATGAGPTPGVNEAEIMAASLAITLAASGPRLTLITDSEALLLAYRNGTGGVMHSDVWAGFKAALPAISRWPDIRRCRSRLEAGLHQAAHNLADAAWMAAEHGGDPALVATEGWCEAALSHGATRVVYTRYGIELLMPHEPPPHLLGAIQYEVARLSDLAEVTFIAPGRLVFRPKRQGKPEVIKAIHCLVADMKAMQAEGGSGSP